MPLPSWLFVFALTAMLFLSEASAQPMLAFQKGNHRVAHYERGDVISYKLVGGQSKITGQIEGFTDSTIVFRSYEVNPRDITHIYVDDKTKQWFAFRHKYEKVLLIAGFGFLMLDVINTGELTQDTKWVSLSLIAAGLTARFLITDRFKIKGRKRLAIIGNEPGLLQPL
jgi:hypothetical protein